MAADIVYEDALKKARLKYEMEMERINKIDRELGDINKQIFELQIIPPEERTDEQKKELKDLHASFKKHIESLGAPAAATLGGRRRKKKRTKRKKKRTKKPQNLKKEEPKEKNPLKENEEEKRKEDVNINLS